MRNFINNRVLLSAIVLAFAIQSSFAATYTAVQSGAWASNSTWDLGSVPQPGDNVIIPGAYTVTVPNGNNDMGSSQIEVYGILNFGNSGKITLNNDGVFYIINPGYLTGSGTGAKVTIGNEQKWQGSDGDVVGDQAITNESDPNNSPNFKTPIPPEALLPVELIYFDAEMMEGSRVELTWATATEINNDYFAIQRSKDCRDWTTVGEVEGALNSQKTIQYSFTDLKAASGNSYYRLVQFDTDGDYSISNTVAVKNTTHIASSVFPNPSNGRFHFSIDSDNLEDQNIKIFNANGQLIDQVNVSDQMTTIDLTERQTGSYFYQIDNGQEITQNGMIIKN